MKKIVCILICLLAMHIYARTPYIRHLGTPEGLPDLLVNTIHRDSTGLVWLGTGSSVEMFDGIRFTHFPLPESNDFSQRVTAIVGHSTSELFVGNSKGLYSLSAEKNKPIAQAQWQRVGENQIIGAVSDLYLTNETLYVATDHGLYICHLPPATYNLPPVITHHPLHPNELNSANQLRHLCMDDDGILWMTSPVGLHALLPNQQVNHYLYPDLPEGGFNCICYIQDTLLLGTFHSGVYFFSISNATYGLYKDVVQPISALQSVGDDTLLIATDGGGVQMYNRHSLEPLPIGNASFTSSNVYSMLYDQDGLLWVGYYQQGLDYTVHQDKTIGVYHTPTWDSYGKAVRAIAVNESHKLIGTRNGLFLIDKQSGQVRTYTEHQLNAQMIFALCYHNNRFYIGTFGGGLFSLSTNNLQPATCHLQPVNPEVGSQIFCLTADSLGLLWVGSEKGVFALKGQQIIHHFDAQSSKLPRGNVYAIFFDRMGRGWFCTQTGLAIYDAEQHTIRTDIFPNTFPHQQAIRSVFQDRQGTLYFLPDKGRIFSCNEHLHPKQLGNLPQADGLFITQDAEQHIWLGTTNGLYRYRINDSQLTLQDYFDFASGLPDNIFTLCQPYWDVDSTLWMGHSRGLVYLKPATCHLQPVTSHPSPIVIDAQQQDGDVTFFFSDLSYTLPQYTHYTYRLKGYELDEHTLNGSSQCSYTNLPMGRYTFLLRSSNLPAPEFAYELRVPMSRQDWLILTTILLSLIIIGLLVLYFLHRYRYHPKSVANEQAVAKEDGAYRTYHLSSQQLKSLSAGFCQTITHDKLYMNPSLRIADVANKMQVSSYSLSYMINQHMHTSFNDYINKLRIDSFCQRVQKGDAKRFSIDTLAQECGFVSRAGFFRNFKKQMHQTPNEYIQSITSKL